MMRVCFVCGLTRPGARVDNKWYCDDHLNSPHRTRPWLHRNEPERQLQQVQVVPEAGTGKKIPVQRQPINKLVIRDGDIDGDVVDIPSEVQRPVTEAEIAKAKEEAANDPVYAPSNKETLARLGKDMVPAEETKANGKAKQTAKTKRTASPRKQNGKAADKGARQVARSAKGTKTRKSNGTRGRKAS